MNSTSPRTDVVEVAEQEEPAFTLRLTRAQVRTLLGDSQDRSFPDLDSEDFTVAFFNDLKRWYLENRTGRAVTHLAQLKEAYEGSTWRTVGMSEKSGHDAAWGRLTNEMQHRGLRYGELSAHIADMENGEELVAEDGTGFRIVAPGQDVTQ
jgi:hypothetical protein